MRRQNNLHDGGRMQIKNNKIETSRELHVNGQFYVTSHCQKLNNSSENFSHNKMDSFYEPVTFFYVQFPCIILV